MIDGYSGCGFKSVQQPFVEIVLPAQKTNVHKLPSESKVNMKKGEQTDTRVGGAADWSDDMRNSLHGN